MLMTQKKYTEALAQAKELKTKLDSDARFWDNRYQVVKHGDILYGYNLLRIAFLEQLCGNLEGELQAWNELKKHVGWAPSTGERKLDPQSCELLCQNFQKNSISLQDFIEHREHLLKAALDGSAASTQ
jgi:hypothetical protein